MRQAKARAATNRTQRSQLRSAIKKARSATDAATRTSAYAAAEKLIDRAGRKRLIHPNAAGRLKSRLKKAAAAPTK
jgi:small subunit ribosomal protein S20